MQTVTLSPQEWQQVLRCMAFAPGHECIGLLNKMGEQLRVQTFSGGRVNGPADEEIKRPS